MAQILLHGTLHATIYDVDKLHGTSGGNFLHKVVEHVGEALGSKKSASKLYATIDLERARVGRTRLLENDPNPQWYESFHIYCAHMASRVVFSIKGDNPIGAVLIGRAYISVKELLNGEEVDRLLEIVNKDGKPIHGHSKLHVKVQFLDVSKELNWARGIRSPKFPGVPFTFFTQRNGCRVTLYQDAHIPDKFIPPIPLSGGKNYEPHRCWEDIFDAISNAKHLIYITGWSVYTEIKLMRDSRRQKKPGWDSTLGSTRPVLIGNPNSRRLISMAEEAIVAADSPAPLEHKRKHEDGETEALEPSMGDSNAVEKAAVAAVDSEESEAKRPRAEEQPDELVTENGFQEQKVDEPVKEDVEPPSMDSGSKIENAQESIKEEALEMVNKEQTSNEDHQIEDIQQTIVENAELENSQQQPYPGVLQDASAQVPQQGDISSSEQKPASDTQTTSQKIEVPNNKVGVLIGKAGDTIRFLQKNSGAKIQITRDADTDPQSTTRAVELIGTPENIIKAEKLIQDVIAEADAGGSPSLVARGFSTVQAAGAAEQILIQVPNEKVGVIIGKGGETIKSLQTRSGARIQLIPQHLPEGDQSKERTVRVSGDKKQIEIAREMIKEVMTQIWQLPSSWGQHFLLGVAITNQ